MLAKVQNYLFKVEEEEEGSRAAEKKMASNAAAPFWRSAGMTYITYSNLCANLVRNCLKEPYKAEALSRERVHYSISKWADGKPQKPSKHCHLSLFWINNGGCLLIV